MKHGAFSKMIFLPGEDYFEFEGLREALKEEWCPEGPLQNDKVFNIAQNMWRKRQVQKWRKERAAEYGEEVDERHVSRLKLLIKCMEDIKAGKSVSELQLPEMWAQFCKKNVPRSKFESDAAWEAAYKDAAWEAACKDEVSTVTETEALHGRKSAENVVTTPYYDPKVVEADLAIWLDAKIDKDILALGRMKTMQSMGLGSRPKIEPTDSSERNH